MPRDISIDILRAIAIIAIVFVHVYPSSIAWQFADFNVCLIVFLSGVSFSLSAYRGGYKQFCIKRLKRIIAPTWVFLTIWYIGILSGFAIKGRIGQFNWIDMLKNYSLMTGWYVWVMRVFLFTALMSPIVHKLADKKYTMIAGSVLVLVLYEFFHIDYADSVPYYVSMCIPYLSIFVIGYYAYSFSNTEVRVFCFVSMAIAIILGILIYKENGHFLNTNNYKTPPLFYYTSFGIGSSFLLWNWKETIERFVRKLRIEKILAFIGSHTIWFYFIHIPIVVCINTLSLSVLLKFIIVLSSATLFTWLYVKCAEYFISFVKKEKIRKDLALIFLG